MFGAFGSLLFAVIIVASCISTLSSTILTTASNISYDIYKQWINPNASEKSVVLVSRYLERRAQSSELFGVIKPLPQKRVMWSLSGH